MNEHEPYVADAAEPRPPSRMARVRPAVATSAVVLLLLAGAVLLMRARALDDPALEGRPGAGEPQESVSFRVTTPWLASPWASPGSPWASPGSPWRVLAVPERVTLTPRR